MTRLRLSSAAVLGTSLLTLLVTALAVLGAPPARADPRERPWSWPIDPAPTILERFTPPDQRWSAGHRGVDLAAEIGHPVVAVADGVVTFASELAGRGVVVVDHGGLRSTYEPVTAAVRQGDLVVGGQILGVLQVVRSHCLPDACLHLGARVGDEYVDPENLLGYQEIRLKPLAGAGPGESPDPSSGTWIPAVGSGAPVTSDFGPRIHPITGRPSFHDGVDYGVGCGTPIVASAAGTVIRAGSDPVYGHLIVISHRGGLETRYGHMYADGVFVGVGDRIRAGQLIGAVGSDGWSTGCHLHFTVASNGDVVDPRAFVPW